MRLPMRVMDKPVGDFVKLYRSLLDWEWYHDLNVRVLFIHLLLEVNYLPGRFEGHEIAAGSIPTSADKLAAKSGLTRQSVRTALEKLKSTGEITIQATSRFSVVTLVNWEKYQWEGSKSTRRTTSRATIEQPAFNQRSTTIEEGKKGRREEVSIEARRESFINSCKAVIEATPERLPKILRQGFLDYWTEPSTGGRMRFEDQKYFDHGRRMDTWLKRATERGEVKPTTAEGKPIWNPRA